MNLHVASSTLSSLQARLKRRGDTACRQSGNGLVHTWGKAWRRLLN
ncbi:uncharacterized protein CTRU02_207625 [Colletotrichum truncatum]|uniref:Uncharacterized protein n=1 Tax=Colletotrichum truncatum TaxID=5467 RepID=A0ACC3Z1C6_COLTU|nr:uncharacterized protein CTRU02_09272 [Colletotrichum truncatum]KAF6788951.1 hypothetical protein CTRU02_09272 [Colletotrichum truncatum]